MHCIPCTLSDHGNHDPLLGIPSCFCFWQSIPFGIRYNCLYQLGYSLMQFPVDYSHIISGMFMPFSCPWCPGEFLLSLASSTLQMFSRVHLAEFACLSAWCQGTTCFLLQSCLGVLPTPTSDTFSILQTPTASQFQRCFRGLPFLSPFQQSPTLPCTPSTPTPHLTPPPKAALRPPPPPKVTQRPLWTPHPPV